jgi:hypothetical protein
MDPDHDRAFLIGAGGRCPEVEGQAILAVRRTGPMIVFQRREAAVAVIDRLADAIPGERRLRGAPAQIANRRRSIGDAFECQDALAIARRAAQQACLDAHLMSQIRCRHIRDPLSLRCV